MIGYIIGARVGDLLYVYNPFNALTGRPVTAWSRAIVDMPETIAYAFIYIDEAEAEQAAARLRQSRESNLAGALQRGAAAIAIADAIDEERRQLRPAAFVAPKREERTQ